MPKTSHPRYALWKFAPWLMGVAVMLAPLIAMQFTHEVAWDAADFAALGTLLLGSAGAYSLAVRITPKRSYLAGLCLALLATFTLIWMNLAVGIIGSEDNPANQIFTSIIVVQIAGALIARFKPAGMVWAMAATALAQITVAVILFATGQGATFFLTGIFVALWLGAAWLFGKAAVA